MDKYINLQAGETLQAGDEYSADNGVWRVIPDFMVGDVIPVSNTKWRRQFIDDTKRKKRWTR